MQGYDTASTLASTNIYKDNMLYHYTMATRGSKQALRIRATSTTEATRVLTFASLQQARQEAEKLSGGFVHHQTIKRWADGKKEMYGYRWERVADEDGHHVDVDVEPIENVFTFHDCMEGIFNGGKVRVTDETPRRVSVFDVIRLIIGEDTNPRVPWERLCRTVQDIVTRCNSFRFPGSRGGTTPVTDAQGVMFIVNALPGQRARQFRMGAMDILTRFLAGDQTLHDELDDNAARQAQLSENHPMQIFTDELYANPKSAKYLLRSPMMKGKYITDFYRKPVVYLLEFHHNSKNFIKVGWSTDFKERITAHFTELPGCTIYCVHVIDNPMLIEYDWKEAFRAFNDKVDVNGSIKTELFTGITIEEGEQLLVRMCEEQRLKQMEGRKHDYDLKSLELESRRMEFELKRMEFELKRMEHERVMKQLELQILEKQEQAAIRST